MEDQLHTLSFRLVEMETAEATTREENSRLTTACQQAQANAQECQTALSTSRAEASKSSELLRRQQDMLAQVTADNLMYMVKLKQSDADLAAAREQMKTLQAALDEQQGPWFDEVRCGVQQRVRDALGQLADMEQRLHRQSRQHAEECNALQQKVCAAQQALEAAQAAQQQMRVNMEELQGELGRVHQDVADARKLQQEAEKRADYLAAQAAMLEEALTSARKESARLMAEQQVLNQQREELCGEVSRAQDTCQQLRGEVCAVQGQLEKQRSVNSQLMMRKQEVEWQLLSALAQDRQRHDQQKPRSTHPST